MGFLKKYLLLLIIVLYSLVLHLWRIDIIPPLINPQLRTERIIFAIFSAFCTIPLFFYIQRLFSDSKLSLIGIWIYSVIPWTIEQGRIISETNLALFSFLIFLYVSTLFSSKIIKSGLFIIFLFSLNFVYPHLWVFQKVNYGNHYIVDSFTNIMKIFSFEFLFFNNDSFWLGGVRNWGIIYVSFLPVLFLGVIDIIQKYDRKIIIYILIIGILAGFSPLYPETREFFLSLPFLIIVLSRGLKKIITYSNIYLNIAVCCFFIFILYDIAGFMHYYFVHYPSDLNNILPKILNKF
jgi:hypothetical protein